MQLRDGEITLSQLINRIEAHKNNAPLLLCLDDIRDELIPEAFEKPDKYIQSAMKDAALDKNLTK